ncbi:MAG TPA: helix-turn-helix domain-containing protein [Pseudomonas sp.]|uniref:RodZ family helix-turn-helix domain-containing protein n=1 Tax=Pseudomonas sp. TaxID=306 RepID=UPI002C900F00|nr:RodZ family helix-turn-helix domain-containing protein [Pseudomonas sp.]HRL94191.1 helix-turn-helix domain-containing protein [Pseudomonas sp.]
MKAPQPEVVVSSRSNPGETLRKARESKNLAQAEVAQQLNLTLRALTQVEAGAFDKLPGHTFARGYIRAYAKLLELDQDRLVADFDAYTGTDSAGSSVHALGRIEEPTHLAQSLLRFVSVGLLLGLLAVSFFWWQEQSTRKDSDAAVSRALEHVEVESADGTTEIHPLDEPEDQAVADGQALIVEPASEIEPELAAQAATAAPAADTATSASQPAPVVEPAAVVVAPVAAVPAAPVSAALPSVTPVVEAPGSAPAPVQAAAGQALVNIQFTANCWTQLTDANGKVLFSALKRAGESLELTGKPPLELRLGFARGAQVSYNGQAVDVAPYTSGETARMKLGQ